MNIDHDMLVGFAKSFGLFYLLGLSVLVLIYTFWPANKKQFDRAAEKIVEDEDRPWE
jgi:cytochrome c oxidase cbb3-type subunit 4